ncbi:unnamed protein product [Adineta ricciae]|uniref:Uncharacterized protein n=1 Tax=Adineta ricciae TaxID=249248 RepID=A0A813QPU2_ADIRI|nr:unnamed protein product [Adineta ricciae]CAF0771026.1 unnamed protein product [Adineta ricciae]
MILLILFLCIPSVLTTTNSSWESALINELRYSHEGIVTGQKATFRFKIVNSTAKQELAIDSYCFSTTFIGEEFHEKRTDFDEIPTSESEYHGALKMTGLEEEEGNYLVCVIFRNSSGHAISSSRFCHVISVNDRCTLEPPKGEFHDGRIFILLPFVVFIWLAAFLFSCIRDYVYRPRTIDAILKSLPKHHADNLEQLAPDAEKRRRRSTQPALGKRLREDSVLSLSCDPSDKDYFNYHVTNNGPLQTVAEADDEEMP